MGGGGGAEHYSQLCLSQSCMSQIIAYYVKDLNQFPCLVISFVLDFSDRRSEDVISFFWRSVYLLSSVLKLSLFNLLDGDFHFSAHTRKWPEELPSSVRCESNGECMPGWSTRDLCSGWRNLRTVSCPEDWGLCPYHPCLRQCPYRFRYTHMHSYTSNGIFQNILELNWKASKLNILTHWTLDHIKMWSDTIILD